MPWPQLAEAASQVRFIARQHIVRTADGNYQVIDDRYNASPPSMRAALELLGYASGTKVAILGDMLELGPEEESAHREVGELAASIVDWLITCGPRAEWIADAAAVAGLQPARIIRTGDNPEALQAVLSVMRGAAVTASGDDRLRGGQPPTMQRPDGLCEWSILVKGSRGMRMEEIVDGLRASR
jgi:UDP-N-acetylmuramoyl-tripeptide--D-alanyl-D-alanine ligase